MHQGYTYSQTNKKEQDLSEPFIVQTDPALVISSDLLPAACGKNPQAFRQLRIKAIWFVSLEKESRNHSLMNLFQEYWIIHFIVEEFITTEEPIRRTGMERP